MLKIIKLLPLIYILMSMMGNTVVQILFFFIRMVCSNKYIILLLL